jgi:hypothetical protein
MDVVRLGDRPHSKLKLIEVSDGGRKQGKPTVDVRCKGTYWNFYGGLLGKTYGTMTFIPYEAGKELLMDREIYRYSDEEVEAIEAAIQGESPPQGRTPLYWSEDVTIGDALPQLVKGPVNLSDMYHWMTACFGLGELRWGQAVYHELKAKPGLVRMNPTTQWPRWDYDQTWEDIQSCEAGGFRAPYCRGLMVGCLAGHLLTNWMGDAGFLRRLQVELTVPNILLYGDTMWLHGDVVEKYKEKIGATKYRAVDVAIRGVNQLEEEILTGTATVYLPDRGHRVKLPIPTQQ